ncbi:MAG: hypothetical protein HUK24_05900 [Sphaerochaetaceae bacterium]|nr:hypothetical protein [Sphaerochaetaceae bacterium]
MKNRRLITILLFVALVFFIACGIPRIWAPSSENFISNKSTNTFTITLPFYSNAVPQYGPGLVLLYTISDSELKSEVKEFSNKGLTNGDQEFKNGDITYYVFRKGQVGETSCTTVSPRDYHLNLFTVNNTFEKTNSVKYKLNYNFEDGIIKINGTNLISSTTNSVEFNLYRYEGNSKFPQNQSEVNSITGDDFNKETTTNGYYINIFCAVYVLEEGYSNIYWSTLKNVGSIKVDF